MDDTRKILLSGFYGGGNAGDEAILSSILRLVSDELGDRASVTIASTDPEHTRKLHGKTDVVPQLNRKHVVPFLRELRESEYLLIGGGGVVGEPRIVRWAFMILFAKLLDTNVAFIGVGVEEVQHPINRLVLRWSLDQSNVVTVRDQDSADLLMEMGVSAPIETLADPAFVPPSQERFEFGEEPDRDFILVSARYVNWMDVDVDELAHGLDSALDELDATIVFAPFHSDGSVPDEEFSRQIASNMSHSATVIDQQLTFQQLDYFCDEAALVVGMRLHSIILAARRHTKVLGIAYHPKCESILHQLGDDSVIWCNSLNSSELATRIVDLWNATPVEYEESIDDIQEKTHQLVPTITSSTPVHSIDSTLERVSLALLFPFAVAYNVVFKLAGGDYAYRPNDMVGND